jgi:hypothetical protein
MAPEQSARCYTFKDYRGLVETTMDTVLAIALFGVAFLIGAAIVCLALYALWRSINRFRFGSIGYVIAATLSAGLVLIAIGGFGEALWKNVYAPVFSSRGETNGILLFVAPTIVGLATAAVLSTLTVIFRVAARLSGGAGSEP